VDRSILFRNNKIHIGNLFIKDDLSDLVFSPTFMFKLNVLKIENEMVLISANSTSGYSLKISIIRKSSALHI